MAGNQDDIEGRVSALERDMHQVRQDMNQVRQDAAAARILAGGADRDVSAFATKLDAHTKTLNALRETQLEQGERLTALERTVNDGFTEVRGRLDATAAGLDQITVLLTTLIGQQDDQ